MIGPGKYDDLATFAREMAGAGGVVLIVIDGSRGNGFSAQLPADQVFKVPGLLRKVADQIEADLTRQKPTTEKRNNEPTI